jgi:uncharacterized protein
MMETPEMTLPLIGLLSLIGFSAGFLDSIVGGGGLIGTPAMLNLFPHWSILSIVGTNRTSSIVGTSVAARNYFRFTKPEWHLLLPGCVGAFVASFLGAELATQIDGERLKGAVVVAIIALAIYMFVRKDLGQVENRRFTPGRETWAAFFVGSACGFYNGLIGPGTGTFLVFGFVSVLGLDFLKSSAVSKAVNVAGDVSSFAVLAWSGYVVWLVAIPLVIANVAGSFVGSKLAILKGSRFIRQVFFVVVFALIARFSWQLWSN